MTDYSEVRTSTLTDGRTLSYAEYGDPGGRPVFAFHGAPGSRLLFRIADQAACSHGIRVIAPDRPGYGLSDPNPRGSLISFADDVAALAGGLGLDRYAVMGVSGGGPYALACADHLAQCLTVAVVVSGVGPLYLRNSFQGMQTANRVMFSIGRISPAFVGWLLPRLVSSSFPEMDKHVRDGTSPTTDFGPAIFAIMTADQREAIRCGGAGIATDFRGYTRTWPMHLESIHIPFYWFHGDADDLAPTAMARQTAGLIPGCRATFYPGEGHTGPIVKHLNEILSVVLRADGDLAP